MLRAALSLSIVAVTLAACGPKVPPPPPEFEDPARAPTGDSFLEAEIQHALELESMTPPEIEELRRRASGDFASDADLTDYVFALVGRDEIALALQFLHQRAWKAVDDHARSADSLGFAMGQMRWGVCAQMARDYLSRKHSSGHFMVRALCLERAGEHAAAVENLQAASEVMPLDPLLLDRMIGWMEKRSSPGPMPPADANEFEDLLQQVSRRGVLDQLFVYELMGYRPDQPLGSITPGSLNYTTIRAIVDTRSRSYRHCYYLADAESKRRERLKGRVMIEFDIGSLGQLEEPRVALTDWGTHPKGSELNGCLMEQMTKLRFPRPRWGLTQVASHQFSFSPD